MMRAQVSFEYLVIVGLAFLLIIPALGLFLQSSSNADDTAAHTQAQRIGQEMAATAANSYALGRNAWLTLDVNVPEQFEGFYLTDTGDGGNELIIRYYTQYGLVDAVFFPIITLTNEADTVGSPGEHLITQAKPGTMSFRFVSQGLNVSIRDVTADG